MSKPGETEYSKGSFPRTWNSDSFRDNFDEIDWSKPQDKFPAYQPGGCALEKPNKNKPEHDNV